jgi:ATP synthase F1 delta subunit
LYGPGANFAQALFDTCDEQKSDYKAISKDLKDWQAKLKEDPRLRIFSEDTSLKGPQRENTLAEIAKITNYNPVSVEMIHALMEYQATQHLGDVISGFDQLVAHNYGEVTAVITSAEALSSNQANAIKSKLAAIAGKGVNLTIEQKVDPTILGGLTIEMGDQFQDLSVRSAISATERALRAAQ